MRVAGGPQVVEHPVSELGLVFEGSPFERPVKGREVQLPVAARRLVGLGGVPGDQRPDVAAEVSGRV
jgi:hypothetical protein